MERLKTLLAALIVIAAIVAYIYINFPSPAKRGAVHLDISSDGNYVISNHLGDYLVLWDIKNKRSFLVNKKATQYSASFISDSNQFIWQEKSTNQINIEDSNLNHIKSFSVPFPVFYQSLSKDLTKYIATDISWSLYTGTPKNLRNIKPSFKSKYSSKLLDVISIGDKTLTSGQCGYIGAELPVSAGLTARGYNPRVKPRADYSLMNCVTLWDNKTGKALTKYHGNAYKTNATLSPDGKYVVAGDENDLAFVWDAQTGKRLLDLASPRFGLWLGPGRFDKTNLVKQPKDFCWKPNRFYRDCIYKESIIAMRFINNDQYFRFTHMIPYAILYNVLNPKPVKYLKLEGHPDVYSYSSVKSVATAPKAGILVMATNIANGIRVYQYNRKQQTLKLIWAPDEFETTRWQKFAWFWWPRFKKALTW